MTPVAMMPGTATSTALADRLTSLAGVIASIDDRTFRHLRADGVSGSIGAHIRHTLDHVAALVDRPLASLVDYDTRRRGTDVEHSRTAAAAELVHLASRLQSLGPDDEALPVELSAVIDESGRRVSAWSTVGRELVFVLSHTVHHQAIIALLLAGTGHRTPPRFALAPSTPSPVPCVPSA